MTPLFPSPRAAEEFDQVLDGAPAADDRYAALLATVEMLRAQPEVLPRAEFVTDLRSRLMTAAETELAPAPADVHPLAPRRAAARRRRVGTVAASLVIVGGTAGMAAAASGALPGEPLYPLKRGLEQVQTAAHRDDAGRGAALLDHAATRLEEVRQLQQESAEPALLGETLQAFRETAGSGADRLFVAYQTDNDAAHIAEVREFTTQHMDELAGLRAGSVPVDPLLDAADTVAEIDQQARLLCKTCSPADPVAVPQALAGASALSVDTLLARPVSQARADIVVAQSRLDASIRRLRTATERSAGQVPTTEQLARAAADARRDQAAAPDRPVSSTITPDGQLLPALATGTGTAVTDLLTGVTGTVRTITEQLPTTGTPLDTTLGDLTQGLDDTANGLRPATPTATP